MSDGKQYTKPIQSVYCHGWKPQQVSVETCSECARLRADNERLRGALGHAARMLRGETEVLDQGDAYDRALDILDAALAAKGAE